MVMSAAAIRSRIGPGAMPSLERPSPMTFTMLRLGIAGDPRQQRQRRQQRLADGGLPGLHRARHVIDVIGECRQIRGRGDRRPARDDVLLSGCRTTATATGQLFPIRPAATAGSRNARGHPAGDQPELLIGHAGGPIHRQHHRQFDMSATSRLPRQHRQRNARPWIAPVPRPPSSRSPLSISKPRRLTPARPGFPPLTHYGRARSTSRPAPMHPARDQPSCPWQPSAENPLKNRRIQRSRSLHCVVTRGVLTQNWWLEVSMPISRKETRGGRAFAFPLFGIALLLTCYWVLADWQDMPTMISGALASVPLAEVTGAAY